MKRESRAAAEVSARVSARLRGRKSKPIREIAKEAKIGKTLTPRFMRRTFQDLGRAASVHDFVVRAISGHATTTMQEHYSSVSGDEVRRGLAKVIALAGMTNARSATARKAS